MHGHMLGPSLFARRTSSLKRALASCSSQRPGRGGRVFLGLFLPFGGDFTFLVILSIFSTRATIVQPPPARQSIPVFRACHGIRPAGSDPFCGAGRPTETRRLLSRVLVGLALTFMHHSPRA
jgi:hypothetical protein